jgi:C4-dicarboxylate-specific signal transduction histidine kinase
MASVRALIVDNLTARGGELALYVPSHARTVLVDQVLLVRALVNGARNALDAFDAAPMAAPPRIVLRVDVDADRSLRFTMTDNGPGFRGSGEDFFADGRTTRARGSGYGLGSARRAVAVMGGTVSLTSPGPDRGAEFVITLPPQEEAAR